MKQDFFPCPPFPITGQFHQRGAIYSPEWAALLKAGYYLHQQKDCIDINADGDDGYSYRYYIVSPSGKNLESLLDAIKEHYGLEKAKEIVDKWNRRLVGMQSQKLTAQQIWDIE